MVKVETEFIQELDKSYSYKIYKNGKVVYEMQSGGCYDFMIGMYLQYLHSQGVVINYGVIRPKIPLRSKLKWKQIKGIRYARFTGEF